MATELFSNLASTTVSSGGTTAPAAGTVESWTVASSATFPAVAAGQQFHICEDDSSRQSEIMLVIAVSGTTWTVVRGVEGTTPVTHPGGFQVVQVYSAAMSSMFTAGSEIDSAERYSSVDFTTITSDFEVDGMRLIIPPQVRPFKVTFDVVLGAGTGTSAAGSVQGAVLTLHDVTAGSPGTTYGLGTKTWTQGWAVTPVNIGYYDFTRFNRRFPPNSATMTLALFCRTLNATVTNWSYVSMLATESAPSLYPPMLLQAVTL